MIPIKGYASFDPLKSCLIGKNFSGDFFKKNIEDTKVSDPLRRIADETEEDYQALEKILKNANIKTYRAEFDEDKFDKHWYGRPPVCPRDHFAVIGEKFYAYQKTNFYGKFLDWHQDCASINSPHLKGGKRSFLGRRRTRKHPGGYRFFQNKMACGRI